eukprot:scaffold6446_cov104-Isochrysis_galbana.AAC.6
MAEGGAAPSFVLKRGASSGTSEACQLDMGTLSGTSDPRESSYVAMRTTLRSHSPPPDRNGNPETGEIHHLEGSAKCTNTYGRGVPSAECRGAYIARSTKTAGHCIRRCSPVAAGQLAASQPATSTCTCYRHPCRHLIQHCRVRHCSYPFPPTKRGSASRARHLSRRTVAPPGAFAFNSSRGHIGESGVGRWAAKHSVPPRSRYRRRAPRTQAMPGRDLPACRAAACRVVSAWRAVRGLWAPGARSPAAARSRSLAPDWAVGRSCYEPTPQTGGAPSVP